MELVCRAQHITSLVGLSLYGLDYPPNNKSLGAPEGVETMVILVLLWNDLALPPTQVLDRLARIRSKP